MIALSVISWGVGAALVIVAVDEAVCWLAERAARMEVGE